MGKSEIITRISYWCQMILKGQERCFWPFFKQLRHKKARLPDFKIGKRAFLCGYKLLALIQIAVVAAVNKVDQDAN